MRSCFSKIVIGIFLVFAPNTIIAAPGDPDLSFGQDGRVLIDFIDSFEAFRMATAVQNDGKILVASHRFRGDSADIAIGRRNPNGSPDESFGLFGYVFVNFTGIFAAASDILIQPDGKILIAGVATSGSSFDANFGIVRLNPNGSLDWSFGNQGKVITSFNPGYNDFAQSVALQPDGKIVAAGYSVNAQETQSFFAVARYNQDGSLDPTFGGSGKMSLTGGNRPINDGYAVAIQGDGKIVLGGNTSEVVAAQAEFAVVRLNSNGTLDQSFDLDGKVQIAVFGEIEGIHDIVIQENGRIVAVGYADTSVSGGNDDFAMVRLLPNGSLDETFSGDGRLTVSFDPANELEQAWGVAMQANGKIVVSGFSGKSDATQNSPFLFSNFAMVRLDGQGNIDTTFGANGRVITVFMSPVSIGYGITIQKDGKILQIGAVGDTDPETVNSRIAITRHLGDPVDITMQRPIFDFDGDSRTDISVFRPSVGEWWYLRSSDGGNGAVQFGNSSDRLVPADYTGDGKTDVAIWRPSTGEWFILRSEDGSFYSFPFGAAGDIPAPGDFDGDGKSDAAIFRSSTSTWFILKSTGGTDIRTFGADGDLPVIGDYDSDGKSDLAIFRPSNGQWWINRSSSGTTTAISFGTSTDKTTPGDFTGDGKTDVAFFRPTSGEWFILRSEDSSFYSFPFGQTGDLPAAGDYDGDGKMDAAVFRPSNNTWYMLRSTAGFQAVGFGVNGDIPVPGAFVR